jgi:hypothetical protein
MTVVELANAAGVTPRTLHRLEIGGHITIAPKRRHGPSKFAFNKIVAAFAARGVELNPREWRGWRWRAPR